LAERDKKCQNHRNQSCCSQSAFVALIVGFFASTTTLAVADKPKSIDFAGWLTSVNPVAKTISLQGQGKKIFVFNIDIHRRDISRNGNWWNQPGAQVGSLGIAKIGNAVIGKLSLEGLKPVVVTGASRFRPELRHPIDDCTFTMYRYRLFQWYR
jgi:hypothetical protein